MFASAATASRPLAIATTATVATETRAVRDSESRTDMHRAYGFLRGQRCAESRSVVSGTDWWRIQVAKAARDKARDPPPKIPKMHRRGRFPAYQGPREIVLGDRRV